MMKQVDVTITFLEQTDKPTRPPAASPSIPTAVMRAKKPPIHFYRYLYRLVGDPWNWVSRRKMDDTALLEIIHDPNVYIYVLYVKGAPGGLAEIDGRNKSVSELKFFGLAPDFTGMGLGKFFLQNAIDLAWSLNPEKIVLETCTMDHPAALPLYQKFGFSVTGRDEGVVEIFKNDDLSQILA